jgi:hypothetical protein
MTLTTRATITVLLVLPFAALAQEQSEAANGILSRGATGVFAGYRVSVRATTSFFCGVVLMKQERGPEATSK